nr:MAG TPA: hypothetical protein [Caudoviricetes sp.]
MTSTSLSQNSNLSKKKDTLFPFFSPHSTNILNISLPLSPKKI